MGIGTTRSGPDDEAVATRTRITGVECRRGGFSRPVGRPSRRTLEHSRFRRPPCSRSGLDAPALARLAHAHVPPSHHAPARWLPRVNRTATRHNESVAQYVSRRHSPRTLRLLGGDIGRTTDSQRRARDRRVRAHAITRRPAPCQLPARGCASHTSPPLPLPGASRPRCSCRTKLSRLAGRTRLRPLRVESRNGEPPRDGESPRLRRIQSTSNADLALRICPSEVARLELTMLRVSPRHIRSRMRLTRARCRSCGRRALTSRS